MKKGQIYQKICFVLIIAVFMLMYFSTSNVHLFWLMVCNIREAHELEFTNLIVALLYFPIYCICQIFLFQQVFNWNVNCSLKKVFLFIAPSASKDSHLRLIYSKFTRYFINNYVLSSFNRERYVSLGDEVDLTLIIFCNQVFSYLLLLFVSLLQFK